MLTHFIRYVFTAQNMGFFEFFFSYNTYYDILHMKATHIFDWYVLLVIISKKIWISCAQLAQLAIVVGYFLWEAQKQGSSIANIKRWTHDVHFSHLYLSERDDNKPWSC